MADLVNRLVPSVTAARVTSKGTNSRQYITIHETDNNSPGANADAHARLQLNGNSRNASWHITVDDTNKYRSFLDTAICWHAGAKYPRTSGNPRSIGIEICVNKGIDYLAAVRNAAEVTAHLMKEHGIPITRVVQHNYWSGKHCPRHLRDGDWGIDWDGFKRMVLAAYAGKTIASTAPVPKLPYSSVLDNGVQGAAVKRYQADLNTVGDYGLDVDGYFGPASVGATVKFQKKHGLYADGIAGKDTQNKLVSELAKQPVAKPENKPAQDAPTSTPGVTKGDDELFEVNSKALYDAVDAVLQRMENEGKPLSKSWRKKLEDGSLTNSEAIGLLFTAVSRGYFNDAKETE